MEYEFRRNRFEGTVFATFSMVHEVFGRWFSEELANDVARGQSILAVISSLKLAKTNHWRSVGNDLTLDMDTEQVRIFVNAIDFEEDYEVEEGMALYDLESEAYCGLEDFEKALQSWLVFIQEK
ncbi:YacL family protein [Shewanella gaetbuli]